MQNNQKEAKNNHKEIEKTHKLTKNCIKMTKKGTHNTLPKKHYQKRKIDPKRDK